MPRRVMQGVVVSDKMDKSVVVKVERRIMHPIYKKYMRRSKKYVAHDETNEVRIGDIVRIIETRPISKRKCWAVMADEGEPTGIMATPAEAAVETGIEEPGE